MSREGSWLMNQLPEEILVEILYYLEINESVQSVQKVCVSFRQALMKDIFWKTILQKHTIEKYFSGRHDDDCLQRDGMPSLSVVLQLCCKTTVEEHYEFGEVLPGDDKGPKEMTYQGFLKAALTCFCHTRGWGGGRFRDEIRRRMIFSKMVKYSCLFPPYGIYLVYKYLEFHSLARRECFSLDLSWRIYGATFCFIIFVNVILFFGCLILPAILHAFFMSFIFVCYAEAWIRNRFETDLMKYEDITVLWKYIEINFPELNKKCDIVKKDDEMLVKLCYGENCCDCGEDIKIGCQMICGGWFGCLIHFREIIGICFYRT